MLNEKDVYKKLKGHKPEILVPEDLKKRIFEKGRRKASPGTILDSCAIVLLLLVITSFFTDWSGISAAFPNAGLNPSDSLYYVSTNAIASNLVITGLIYGTLIGLVIFTACEIVTRRKPGFRMILA